MSFIQKYLPIVNEAIQKLTPEFIQEYCIEKMKENSNVGGKLFDEDIKSR